MDADYVVVGAGSAGCVIAGRLSETGASVTLLEAGPRDWHPMIHIPAGVLKLLHHPVVNWNYSADAGPGAADRAIHWPRGKVLGGSSSINGMLYVRGNPADFDGWAQMGCRGWSFDDVLPFFRKSEHYVQGGDAEYRGKGGPLRVEDYRTILPLTHRFVEAAQQAGFAVQHRSERQDAGRRRLFADDSQGTLPRLDRADISGGGQEARESARRDRRDGDTAVVRRQTLHRRRVPPARHGSRGACGTRGDPVRRFGQFAASAADFRHRAGGASAIDRRGRGARPAGCRRQPAGPLCRAHLASREECHLDQPACARHSPGGGGRALRGDRPRRADLRRHQRAGVLPLASGTRQPRPATSVHAGELRCGAFRPTGARAWHDGGGVPGASRQPRHDHGAIGRSVRGTGHHAELSVGSERPARAECRHAHHAQHLRRAGDRAAQRARRSCRGRRWFRMRTWPTTHAASARRSIIRSAPAGWAKARALSSIRVCACTASAGCG